MWSTGARRAVSAAVSSAPAAYIVYDGSEILLFELANSSLAKEMAVSAPRSCARLNASTRDGELAAKVFDSAIGTR